MSRSLDIAAVSSMAGRSVAFPPGAAFKKGALAGLLAKRTIRFLTFEQSTLTQKDLEVIGGLQSLRRLGISGCTFPRGGLRALSSLQSLKDLWLDESNVVDADLADVAGIPSLDWLILDGTQITDKGLSKLSALAKLRVLSVKDTSVTNDGVRALARLPKLQLSPALFSGTSVTAECLGSMFAARRSKRGAALEGNQLPKSALKAAEKRVRGFIRAMNAWEKECAERDRKSDKGGVVNLAELERVFAEHCVVKERRLGRAGSYSSPPEYNPRKERVVSAQQVGEGRAEVMTLRPDPYLEIRRAYLLVRDEAAGWRIDSVRDSVGGEFRRAIL